MPTISADQLPSPTLAPASHVSPAGPVMSSTNMWATSAQRPTVKLGLAAAGLVAIGGLGFALFGGDSASAATSRNTDSTEIAGEAENTSVTESDLDSTYQFLFGLPASNSTLECISDEVTDEGPGIVDLVDGEVLTFDEASDTFRPFVRCASDADFAAGIAQAALQVIGGNGDRTCIENTLLSFGVADRSDILALAYADTDGYTNWVYDTFVGCAL